MAGAPGGAGAERASEGAEIPAAERIPLGRKIAFSSGMNADYAANTLLTSVLWMPFFNIGMGIAPATLGGILMILMAWGAFIDPVVGNISDNARTRWGRRRPFMAVAAVLAGGMFPIFWHVPGGLSEWGQAAAVLGIGLVYFTCYSFWAMPYYGLQMELTPNYDERTRLTGWMTFFGKLAYLAGGWALAFFTCSLFANPQTGKGDIVIGLRQAGWVIGLAIAVFGLIPALLVQEPEYGQAARRRKESLWQSLKESWHCRPLWPLIGITFFLLLGSTSVSALQQYLNIYYIFGGDLAAAAVVSGWKVTVLVASSLLLIPVWVWLGERFDKKAAVLGMLLFTMGGHLLNVFCLRPEMPYLQIVPAFFEGGAISAIWLFLPSMKADVADYDELHTQRRREGSLNSFYSWFVKAGLTCATGLSGVLLEFSGFVSKAPHQPKQTLETMFHLFLVVPLALWGIAFLIGCHYPLSRARMAEIRNELNALQGEPEEARG